LRRLNLQIETVYTVSICRQSQSADCDVSICRLRLVHGLILQIETHMAHKSEDCLNLQIECALPRNLQIECVLTPDVQNTLSSYNHLCYLIKISHIISRDLPYDLTRSPILSHAISHIISRDLPYYFARSPWLFYISVTGTVRVPTRCNYLSSIAVYPGCCGHSIIVIDTLLASLVAP